MTRPRRFGRSPARSSTTGRQSPPSSPTPICPPPTERALRDAVIARRISNGTPHRGGLGGLRRHSERLGDLPPPRCRTVALHHRPAGPTCWTDLLARARKGLPHPTIPLSA